MAAVDDTVVFCFQTNLMILYLEAVRYKIVAALDALEGAHHQPTKPNALSQRIETTRDKNGYQMSVLKVRYSDSYGGPSVRVFGERAL